MTKPQPQETWQPGAEGIWQLPENIYRTAPGINNSELKHIRRSPAHYWAQKQKPASEPTDAQLFGTLLHALVLEPESARYVVRPEGLDYRTKEGKAWRAQQTEPVLDADRARDLENCAAAVLGHPLAAAILAEAHKEVAVFKRDEETGLLLKGKLDILSKDSKGRVVIADIKTTDDASPAEFPYSARRWQYIRQPGYYSDLVGAERFLFIAIEKTAPYAVAVYEVDEPTITRSRMLYREDLATLAQCLKKDEWPAYGSVALPMCLV